MKNFNLHRKSVLSPQEIFNISIDVANFHLVLPKYFESLKIIKDDTHEKIVIEKINFLGFSMKVKTKHLILPPNLHHVYILSGPLKGSSFIESYNSVNSGTNITIDISLKFFGFFSGFHFINKHIIKKMLFVMDEFVAAAESKMISKNPNL